ncbi:MAG: NUDIX domain-containing protein [Bacteroidales bacterium]
MEGSYNYKYPRPALTTDSVIFGFDGDKVKVLFVKRRDEPFKGKLALPGGFMEIGETLEECAKRELVEETGIEGIKLRESGTLSDVERDPRTRVVSVVYYGLMSPNGMMSEDIVAGSDAESFKWIDVNDVLSGTKLAFDHEKAVRMAFKSLADSLNREPVAFELLDERFTIKQLQRIYEILLDRTFDRANFHKKMVGDPASAKKLKKNGRKKNTGILTDTGEVMKETKHKPAKYYVFDWQKYKDLMEIEDFNFGF